MSFTIVHHLFQKGVNIPQPDAVYIGPDVRIENIAADVTLMPGCRIEGAATVIGSGSIIGSEGPVVVVDCQIDKNVTLGSGYFESSVFLSGASMGSGAHVRPGCLLEEQANGAHTVGIKQTVLMSYVTLGSLINFCDCLMSGGTSRKNHSEVGSSYIHFNYSPHQDKATPSLIGDVPHGVLLDQSPIFLGGQGGLVGPTRMAFGSVVPAGQVIRQDVLESGQLVMVSPLPAMIRPYEPQVYGSINRIVANNLNYIGNLKALKQWYVQVRKLFMNQDHISAGCRNGAIRILDLVLGERCKRLGELAEKFPESIARLVSHKDPRSAEFIHQQKEFISIWPKIKADIESASALDAIPMPEQLMNELTSSGRSSDYLSWIKNLAPAVKADSTAWLDSIVRTAFNHWKLK